MWLDASGNILHGLLPLWHYCRRNHSTAQAKVAIIIKSELLWKDTRP